MVHGETGFLIPTLLPRCSPELDAIRGGSTMLAADLLAATTTIDIPRLQEYLLALAENMNLRMQMGEAGRARARTEFDWPGIIRKYEELWEELHEKAQGGSMTQEHSINLDSYPYGRIFGHYATREYAIEDLIAPALTLAEGQESALLTYMANPPGWFSKETFRLVLAISRANRGIPLISLIEAASRETGETLCGLNSMLPG